MTRAKICGITHERDLAAAVDAGADAVGVTADVAVDTPREVPVDRAADLAAAVPPFVTSALVTMPESVEEAVELAETVEPDALQIHGDLGPEDIRTVRERVPANVVAAVEAEAPDVTAYAQVSDALLVDSIDEKGGGGTGETHDWGRTRELVAALDVPVVLAGGLTPENVAEAVETVRPFAVDVASGVERSGDDRDARREAERNDGVEREGGRKDHEAVRRFVERATRARVEAEP